MYMFLVKEIVQVYIYLLVCGAVDLKGSDGLVTSSVEETAYNAISFTWSPMKQNAKVRRFGFNAVFAA